MSTPTDTFSQKKFEEIVKAQKMDLKAFQECFSSDRSLKAVKDDIAIANKLKVMGTPYMTLVGPRGTKILNGAYPPEEIKKSINELL